MLLYKYAPAGAVQPHVVWWLRSLYKLQGTWSRWILGVFAWSFQHKACQECILWWEQGADFLGGHKYL